MQSRLVLCLAFLLGVAFDASVQSDVAVEPAKVKLSVFIESLCPDCIRFIHDQLGPVYRLIPEIIDLELVPFGNAEEVQNPDGSWNFTCQHGKRECDGNLIESCALRLILKMEEAFPFIYCLEESGSPDTQGPQCADSLGLDYDPINDCVKSPRGNQWQHENAVRTNQLQPPHTYVPWVLLNEVHTDEIEKRAESNLLELICETYQGTLPPACLKTIDQRRP